MYKNRDPLLRFIGAIRLFLYKKRQIKSCLFTSRKEALEFIGRFLLPFKCRTEAWLQILRKVSDYTTYFLGIYFLTFLWGKLQNRSHNLIKEQKLLKWTIFLRNIVDFLNAFIQPPPPLPEAFHHTLLSMFCENWIILERI